MTEIPKETVTRAQCGDQDACREIIEILHRPVIATVYRFLGPRFRSDTEDVAQEVFLKVFRSIERFEGERGVKFSTWVYTFVRNHCFDVLKKRRLPTVSMTSAVDDDQGQRHGCGKLFEVAFRCEQDRGKLWLSGHAPPTGMTAWCSNVADLFLADCLKRDGLTVLEESAWCEALDAGSFSTRTVHAIRSDDSGDRSGPRHLFRLALAEDMLVVVHGFTREQSDQPLLLRAFDSLRRR